MTDEVLSLVRNVHYQVSVLSYTFYILLIANAIVSFVGYRGRKQ